MSMTENIENQKHNLTHGSILNKLLLIAVPIMGTQLLQMAYNLTDMFWLGRVGSDVVAASGSAGMFLWLSAGFMFIGRAGAEIGVSQKLGANDKQGAKECSENSLFTSIILGVIFAVCAMLFTTQLIGFFNIKEAHVANYAVEYLFITAIGIPATFISATIAGTFNAAGNSKIPFLVNIIGLIANMILDPIFIINFDMKIVGAAIATIISQIAVAIISIIVIKVKSISPFDEYKIFIKPNLSVIKQIFKWSTPVAVESTLFTFLSMIISRFVASYGADAIAVQRIGSQVESLSWLIGGGFATAITAFIGQNFGAGKWTRIRSGFKIALATISIWGVVVTGLLYFAGGFLFSIFLPDPNLTALGWNFLKILSFCQIFGSLEAVSAGAFRGIGKTLQPSIASTFSNAFRVFLTYFLSQRMGIDGIWWGITIGASVRGLWMFIWFVYTLKKQPKEDILVNEKQTFEKIIV